MCTMFRKNLGNMLLVSALPIRYTIYIKFKAMRKEAFI